MNDTLVIDDVRVEYPTRNYVVRAIDGLSASVSSGSLALLLGPSGCGKTTLLSCIAALQTPTAGSIHYGDANICALRGAALTEYRRRSVGIVFQTFNLVPSLTALENITVPLLAGGRRPAESRRRATELLDRVGLADRAKHRPHALSGGQQQRVAIARALAWDPPLILADEPTAHLDYVQVEEVVRLLRDLAEPGRIVLVSTHDERMLAVADHVVSMAAQIEEERGRPVMVALGAGEVLFREGSRGDRVFVVDEGEIELVRTRADGSEEPVSRVGPGDVFGEFGPLFALPRSATARAVRDARVTGYTIRQFRELPAGVSRLASLVGTRVALTTSDGRRRRAPLRAKRSGSHVE